MKINKISQEEKLVKIKKDVQEIAKSVRRTEEKLAARRKKWAERNPEKVKANNKKDSYTAKLNSEKYYKKNKEKLAKAHKAYMKSTAGKKAQARKYLKLVEEKLRRDAGRTKWVKPLNMKRIEECKKLLGIETLNLVVEKDTLPPEQYRTLSGFVMIETQDFTILPTGRMNCVLPRGI